MLITTKLNPNENTVIIELETGDKIMEISLNLKDIEKSINNVSEITNNIIAQKAVEFFSSLFGIKLLFRSKK